ncbi:MAG: L-threonylcarbamoyladenylate synthase [Candidatus Binatia bacterium]
MIIAPTPDAIERAAALLRGGQVVAFPTETVYGLGADATDARAAARVFSIKARPAFDPLIVHLAEAHDIAEVAASAAAPARELVARYWPGPLTIVVPKHERIPDIVTAGLPTVAVRVPNHPVARELLRRSGRPIAAPSANPFGYVSPTTAAHVVAQLGDAVPMILDGGPCRVGLESTIVSFAEATPTLLRHGAISLEALEQALGPIRVRTDARLPSAPGQLPRHYAPRTPLTIASSASEISPVERRDTALLSCVPCADTAGFAAVEILSAEGDLEVAAARLFAALRAADGAGYRRIVALAVPERGIGRAIMDRLRRASAPPA